MIVSIAAAALFTPFTNNIAVSMVVGLSYPQIVAVGDVNTGGESISLNSPLYPSPFYVPIATTQFVTINGPAIKGAFVNNTSQGFIIGLGNAKVGAAAADTSSSLVGAAGNFIGWRAFLHDMSIPY